MTNVLTPMTALSDDELLIEVRHSVAAEGAATTHLIAVLAEFDARRLYLGEGCSSLFTYCTQVLRLSEHAAYGRIEAARLARRVPQVLDALRNDDVTLSALCLLGSSPHAGEPGGTPRRGAPQEQARGRATRRGPRPEGGCCRDCAKASGAHRGRADAESGV